MNAKELRKEVFDVMQNELPGLAMEIPAEEASLYELIIGYMAQRGEDNTPSPVDGLTDSSIWNLLIYLALEDHFGIEIDDAEILAVETFGDLVKLVGDKLRDKQSTTPGQ